MKEPIPEVPHRCREGVWPVPCDERCPVARFDSYRQRALALRDVDPQAARRLVDGALREGAA